VLGIFITVFLLPAGLFFGEFQKRFRVWLGTPLPALLRVSVYQIQRQGKGLVMGINLGFPLQASYFTQLAVELDIQESILADSEDAAGRQTLCGIPRKIDQRRK